MSDFVYLNVHTFYSPDSAAASPAEWCRAAAGLGYRSLALADRAPMPAFPEFSTAAREEGLAPVFGMEVDFYLPSNGSQSVAAQPAQPALLFAYSRQGLSNLALLSTQAYAGWPGEAQALDWIALLEHSEGLVLILPGYLEGGQVSPLVASPQAQLADWLSGARQAFPHLFLGLPPAAAHGGDLQTRTAEAATALGIPPVALPPARYIRAEDAPVVTALQNARAAAGWRGTGSGPSQAEPAALLLSPVEVATQFSDYPEALQNAASVAETCSSGLSSFSLQPRISSDLSGLKAKAEHVLKALLGPEDLPDDIQQRLTAELGWVEKSGTAPAWLMLAALADVAAARHIALGALLGQAEGSLVAAGLGLWPGPGLPSRSAWLDREDFASAPPPGIEVPADYRSELIALLKAEYGPEEVAFACCHLDITPLAALRAAAPAVGLEASDDLKAVAQKGWSALVEAAEQDTPEGKVAALALALRGAPVSFKPDQDTLLPVPAVAPLLGDSSGESLTWLPWTGDSLCESGYPTMWLRPSSALSVLTSARRLSSIAGTQNGTLWPEAGDGALEALKKGQLAGVPYISADAAKGWKGDFSPESIAALVARSHGPSEKSRPKAPEGAASWTEQTQATDGALLYYDQFEAIVQAEAGISPAGAAALRRAMLNPDTDLDGALHARFIAGCASSGLDEVGAEGLWKALSVAATGLFARGTALAWGRTAAQTLALKVAFPAAFLAAHLGHAWAHRGPAGIPPLADEARHMGVTILPPSVATSLSGPTPEQNADDASTTSVRWGLALLPGWDNLLASRFVAAREAAGGCTSIGRFAEIAAQLGLSRAQLEALIRSGACDPLGSRDAMTWAISGEQASQQAVSSSEQALSPRTRYARREWEEQHLGIRFTQASEMDELRKAVGEEGGLRARLVSSNQLDDNHMGQSVCVVGVLHNIRQIERPPGTGAKEAERMAVAWVEDLDGGIELVAFPPNYKRHAELWTENNLVIVTARVCKHGDGEGFYLLCEHLAAYHVAIKEEELNLTVRSGKRGATVPLPTPDVQSADGGSRTPATAPAQPRPAPRAVVEAQPGPARTQTAVPEPSDPPNYNLVITLPSSNDDHEDIDRMIELDRLLRRYPGPDTVTLRIPYSPETRAVTSAQLPRGVRYSSALEAGIRLLLGPEALALIKLIV